MSTDTPSPEGVTLTDDERAMGHPMHLNGVRVGLAFIEADAERILAAREQALREEIAALHRWKAEALPVIAGLQELGKVLGLRLGVSITGEAAAEAARALVAERNDLRARLAKADELAQSWAVEAVVGRKGNGHPLLVQTYDGHARDLRSALAPTTDAAGPAECRGVRR